MNLISSTLEHRVAPPEQSTAEQHPALIFLHGRGADEEDLMGLAPYLDPRFFLLSVRAPFAFPYGGYTWYEVGTVGIPEPGMFQESYGRLVTFVQDAVKGYPIDPSQVFLFGFSMGTVMSY